jgi:hypothetical protein
VPWDAVALQPDEKVLLLKIEKEKIEKAPNFESATLPELANRQWGAVIHLWVSPLLGEAAMTGGGRCI